MRVIAISNQKGGCGKTTTSINLAACLAHLHKEVLLIDLDPQGHSTVGLGVRDSDWNRSIYDLLHPQRDHVSVQEAVMELHPGFFLMPSNLDLSDLEQDLAGWKDRDLRLQRILNSDWVTLKEFDYVILDCPPNLGTLTLNALTAADEIVIPIEPSFFSLHGLAKMTETINMINLRRENLLEIHALLTIFDSRTRFAEEVYEEVRAHFGERMFKSVIHENVMLKEAAGAGQSIVEYSPHSSAYRDYLHLAKEYMEKEWERRLPEEKLGWDNFLTNRYSPRPVLGGVLFQFYSDRARWVEIAGDFNNWVAEPLKQRDERGLWQKVIPVSQRCARYKYIIDGEWQIDPSQPLQRENQFGSVDSYLEIA